MDLTARSASDITRELPIVVVASVLPQPGRLDEVLTALAPIMAQIQQEPGCLLYALHTSDDGRVHFIEKWASKADGDRHATGSPAMALLGELVSPMLDMATMSFTELRPVLVGVPSKGLVRGADEDVTPAI